MQNCRQSLIPTAAIFLYEEVCMPQEVITRILDIEREAVQLVETARADSAAVIEEANQAMQALRERMLADARKQTAQIAAQGQTQVERIRILAEAEAELHHIEHLAAGHYERAVQFVLDQVAGTAA